MKSEKNDKTFYYKIKLIIVGDAGVGKTNLIHRFAKGEFKNDYHLTIGMDFLSQNIQVDDKYFSLEIWDTAGSEKFKSITKGFYNNSTSVIVVYDITDEKSFISISNWIEDVKNYSNKKVDIVLVGNKNDLIHQRVISKEDGQEMSIKNEMRFYECSALTGENVENIFLDICKNISKNIDEGKYDFDDESPILKKCETISKIKINKRTFSQSENSDKNIILDKSEKKKKTKTKKCC